jgi:hypothetical protein
VYVIKVSLFLITLSFPDIITVIRDLVSFHINKSVYWMCTILQGKDALYFWGENIKIVITEQSSSAGWVNQPNLLSQIFYFPISDGLARRK